MAAEETPGTVLGPYRIERLLGRGGFGEVYEATDTDKGRVVALKLLAAPYANDPVFRQRLFREAGNAGRLHSPNVVPVHSYGEVDGRLYIDMRLVPGVDLATLLAREGALEPARAVWIVRQIASALDAAHEAGMVHRDVKPGNILCGADDFACLVDFGLANAAADTKLTGTGSTIGTFAYVAPERFIDSGSADHRADIYALACVLYECLTATTPFGGSVDLPSLMGAHLNAPIPRPSQTRPGVPTAFDEVVARGMAKDPAARYQTAGELAAAAHRALVGPAPTPASPPPEPDVQAKSGVRRRIFIAGGAAAVVVAAAATAGMAVSRKGTSQQSVDTHPTDSAPDAAPSGLAPGESILPFAGLQAPYGIAVDGSGNVYVADQNANRVFKLAAGSESQTELPFDASSWYSVGVDGAGTVYTAEYDGVVKLAPGSTMQVDLPDLPAPPENGYIHVRAMTADAAGAVYVVTQGGSDPKNSPVLKLEPGATQWTVLPITGMWYPRGIAVDAEGSVYVTEEVAKMVVKLPTGSGQQVTLPFGELKSPSGVAVGPDGSVYVVDYYKVLKLAPGAAGPIELPFSRFGAINPEYVAVDAAGAVYVTNLGSPGTVVKLAPQ